MLKATASALALLCPISAHAADQKPSAYLCWRARAALAEAGSEKAAEDAARAHGVSEATIRLAKRRSK